MAKSRKQKMAKSRKPTKSRQISFDYEKSRLFRVIRVDGAIGSPTPKGDGIQMGLFSERVPIPQHEDYTLKEDGRLGDLLKRKSRPVSVFREVEVEAMVSLEVAKQLQEWLRRNIEAIEKVRAKAVQNA